MLGLCLRTSKEQQIRQGVLLSGTQDVPAGGRLSLQLKVCHCKVACTVVVTAGLEHT